MRSNMTDAGRYKLICRLQEAEGYEAYAALDIETSLRQEVLLNVYTGQDVIRRMVALHYGMDGRMCPDYCRIYTEDGRFTVAFVLHKGRPFAAVFSPKGGPEEALRQAYAQTLLHAVLENAAMPPELLRAMLREENLVVQEKEKRIYLNAVIPPVAEGADGRAVTLALSPLVERVLGRKWSATDEQIDWMDHLAQGRFESVSALYSAWRELLPVMEEDLKKGRLLSCVFRFLKRCGRRWWTKHKQARAQKRRAAEQNA